jgi:hypothetical protein
MQQYTNIENTPTSKSGVKQSSASVDSDDVVAVEVGDISATKPYKLVRVKVEPKE